MKNSSITVLVDNESWITPYAMRLVDRLTAKGFDAAFCERIEAIRPGWINFMLGCTKLVAEEVLQKNRHNLVVHESRLPQGRGFAPMTWQILGGKNRIPVCLIEAVAAPDAGDIWIEDVIELKGNELCAEWRARQGDKTLEMCLRFVDRYDELTPHRQQGEPSWYPRRGPGDSRLDIDRPLREQFDLLRVVDNERYPAYFEIEGQVYTLQIHKAEG
ncbi:hypothetical protein [Salinicola endophyticus]|uniref:hypothetical protein n=1 Tax=Salinicola endophyticus TaxID=1949083 RepID=UPI001CB74F16|nr:hypothetical protein [Salinicola endophyticus]